MIDHRRKMAQLLRYQMGWHWAACEGMCSGWIAAIAEEGSPFAGQAGAGKSNVAQGLARCVQSTRASTGGNSVSGRFFDSSTSLSTVYCPSILLPPTSSSTLPSSPITPQAPPALRLAPPRPPACFRAQLSNTSTRPQAALHKHHASRPLCGRAQVIGE